jgi:hypothetical protein
LRICFLENAPPYNSAPAADEGEAGGGALINEIDKDNAGESSMETQAWRPWRFHRLCLFFFFFSFSKSGLDTAFTAFSEW